MDKQDKKPLMLPLAVDDVRRLADGDPEELFKLAMRVAMRRMAVDAALLRSIIFKWPHYGCGNDWQEFGQDLSDTAA